MYEDYTMACGCEVMITVKIYEGYGCAGDCCTSTEVDIQSVNISYCGIHADKE